MFKKKSENGMTFLEVLVSMLIIGLALGMSFGMIQTSARYERSARDRAYALESVNSLISMMRSNKLGAASYRIGTANQPVSNIPGGVPNSSCTRSTCSDEQYAEQMAKVDLYNWLEDVKLGLPGAKVSVVNNGFVYNITVSWTRISESETAANHYNSEASLTTSVKIL